MYVNSLTNEFSIVIFLAGLINKRKHPLFFYRQRKKNIVHSNENDYHINIATENIMNQIPSLASLLEEYYKALLPFMNEGQAKAVYTTLEDYRAKHGTALTRLIQEYVESTTGYYNNQRMIEDYCRLREALPLTSNFGIHLHTFDKDNIYTWLEYTAHIIHTMIILCNAVIVHSEHHELRNCFGVCKLPRTECDSIQYTNQMTHYIIHHKGNCYRIPFYNEDGILYSADAIYTMLLYIICEEEGDFSSFLSLSYHGSHVVYDYICKYLHGDDISHLESLQKAQFNIILCDTAYTEEQYASVAYPMESPVWTYSSCSLLIWKNKEITGYFEHTCIDGTLAVLFLETVAHYYKKHIPLTYKHECCPYEPLSFTYTAEQRDILATYRQESTAIFSSLLTTVYTFDINALCKRYSADAFIQCMLQYALYSINGFLSPVYEPVRIRISPDARVEAVRPVTCESKKLIESLYKTKTWNDSHMNDVCTEHRRRIQLCQQGQYFSSFFALLSFLTQGTEAHALFTTKEFELLDSDYLVTSHIGNSPYIRHFFYMRELPVHYNIGYFIQDNIVTLCCIGNALYVHMEAVQQACEEFYSLALHALTRYEE